MARTERATGGRRSAGIAWMLAGLLAACGGATVSGMHSSGTDGGGSGGLDASGGAAATAGAGGTDASAGSSGTGDVAASGGTAGDAMAGTGGSDAGCPTGYADCNGDPSDGCETHIATDVDNCGKCGHGCAVPNGPTMDCVNGICGFCCDEAGRANCGGNCADGCDTDITNDVNNCGGCGVVCSVTNGTPACVGGACSIAACFPGYADCDGLYSTGCETNLRLDAANCGSCGEVCSTANGAPSCVNGSCGICECQPPYADCDGNCSNGCETNTAGDVNNCGACGKVCTVKNGTPACIGGVCAIASCDPDYADCDGQYSDGCETNLATDPSNCGACGKSCGCAECLIGRCMLPPPLCLPGSVFCAGGCNCVDLMSDPQNCGACGHACTSGQSCVSGTCQ